MGLLKLRQRSVRLNGIATCLRLEEIYWEIIEKLAREESLTVGKLISRWAMELDLANESILNFTGYVRVVCVVQLIKRMDSARQPVLVSTSSLPDAPHGP